MVGEYERLHSILGMLQLTGPGLGAYDQDDKEAVEALNTYARSPSECPYCRKNKRGVHDERCLIVAVLARAKEMGL